MSLNKQDLLKGYSKLIDDKTILTILKTLNIEYKNKNVFPEKRNIFKCFNLCDYDNLKVVILGQDPYPQKGFATGLAFGNPKDTKICSPSLQVIINKITKDFPNYNYVSDLPFPDIYDDKFDITLESWAKQGVLLLNSSLTVEENKIQSHSDIWYTFIKELLIGLSSINSGIVYLLFGNSARNFKPFINKKSNYIFEYKHPSYFARNNQGFDCDGFIQVNKILKQTNNLKIQWI
jgi:uracil-DNA glycosylase